MVIYCVKVTETMDDEGMVHSEQDFYGDSVPLGWVANMLVFSYRDEDGDSKVLAIPTTNIDILEFDDLTELNGFRALHRDGWVGGK